MRLSKLKTTILQLRRIVKCSNKTLQQLVFGVYKIHLEMVLFRLLQSARLQVLKSSCALETTSKQLLPFLKMLELSQKRKQKVQMESMRAQQVKISDKKLVSNWSRTLMMLLERK